MLTTILYNDNLTYVGDAIGRNRHGFGILFYFDTPYYIGEWENDAYSGWGIMYENNTPVLSKWENGQMIHYNNIQPEIIQSLLDTADELQSIRYTLPIKQKNLDIMDVDTTTNTRPKKARVIKPKKRTKYEVFRWI